MRFLLLAVLALPTISVAEEKQDKKKSSAVTDKERLAVIRSSRQFRIQVFEAFRRERSSYNAYSKQGENVLRAWDHPMSELDHKHVLSWFAAAKRDAQGGVANPPAVPTVIQQTLLHVDSLPKTRLPRRTVDKTAIERTPIEAFLPRLNLRARNVKARQLPRKKARAKLDPTIPNANTVVPPPAPAAPLTKDATPGKSSNQATGTEKKDKK